MAYEAKTSIRAGEAVPVTGDATCDRGLLTLAAARPYSLYGGVGQEQADKCATAQLPPGTKAFASIG